MADQVSGDRGQIEELYRALDNDNVARAIELIDAAGEARNTLAEEPLTILLEYPDEHVRAHSSLALGKIRGSTATAGPRQSPADLQNLVSGGEATGTPVGGDSASNQCARCGKLELFPARCPLCGCKFCAAHKAPESHQCQGLTGGRPASSSGPITSPLPVRPPVAAAPPPPPPQPEVARPTVAEPPVAPVVAEAKKAKAGWKLPALCIAVILTLLIAGGLGAVGYGLLFPPVWTEKLPFKNSTGQYDVVVKYRNATDVTAGNLSAFLAEASPPLESAVDADEQFRCVEYAVALHNEAEQRQINCSVVGTDMLGGAPLHAVVQFSTTDGGVVYVDPTAMNVSASDYEASAGSEGLDFTKVKFLRGHWTGRQPFLNGSGERPEITSYRNASPVSYAELQAFLAEDHTENRTYVEGEYSCLDFASELYDRAEARGIKGGVVSVSFRDRSVGHAFNVFPTTDKGLVYVDDTGINKTQQSNGDLPRDNVVYLQAGKELGEFPISQAGGNLDYGFYLDMKGRLEAYFEKWKVYSADLSKYNAEVDDYNNQSAANNRFYDAYNAECNQYSAAVADYNSQMSLHNQAVEMYNAGNTGLYIPPAPSNLASLQSWKAGLDAKYDQYSQTWNRLDGWKKQLDDERKDLEARRAALLASEEYSWVSYTPPGVVKTVDVYWG